MEIIRKKFCNWSTTIQDRLQDLSFGWRGAMLPATEKHPNTITYVAFDKDHVVGWLAAGSIGFGDAAMIYTNPQYRREGVAIKLVKRFLHNYNGKLIYVFPHDMISNLFWSKAAKHFKQIVPINNNSFIETSKSKNLPITISKQWSNKSYYKRTINDGKSSFYE